MKSVLVLVTAVVFFALPARAQMEIGMYSGVAKARFVGDVGGLAVRVHSQAAALGRAELSWLFASHDAITLSIAMSEPRISMSESSIRYGGQIRIRPMEARFEHRFAPDGGWQPMIGAGLAYYVISSKREASSPSVPSASLQSPDHAALTIAAGLARVVGPGTALRAVVEYGPAVSTAETNTPIQPGNELQTNFHPLMVSFGITKRF